MCRRLVAAAGIVVGLALLGTGGASAETRSLKIINMHTREKAEIIFKRNGRYDQDGLRKLNHILRDWRKNEPTRMDPRLFDLIWEAYRQSGSREYINVVCGYRSPATNAMLRSRSKGVAKKSQHMLGKAMDFYIPGVKLKKLREIGLKMQGGGVGYYPTSGSPFVHFDVGNVRHWPKMSRSELIALFPNGKTLHVPSDGKPLPGFDQALASYNARKKSGDLAVASLGSRSSSGGSRSGGLLSAFFGGGADEEEDASSAIDVASAAGDDEGGAPAAATRPAPKADVGKNGDVKAGGDKGKIRILSPDEADRVDVASIDSGEQVEVAGLPTSNVPLPVSAPRAGMGALGPAGLYGPADQASGDLTEQVAAEVPLPTSRPADAATETSSEEQAVAMADALSAPLPTARPEEDGAGEDQTTIAEIMPVARPEPGADDTDVAEDGAEQDGYTVASLSDGGQVASDKAFVAAPGEIIPDTDLPAGETSAEAAAPGTEVAALEAKPATASGPAVKTTPKAARATRANSKAIARQPVVLAAQPEAARWALDTDYVAQNSKGTTAPSPAYDIVHGKPSEVYTAGFQANTVVASADLHRFSGKAVNFMTVARFKTN